MKISKELVFVCDANEFSGVKKISKMVAGDVKLVFGFESKIVEDKECKIGGDRPLCIW